jgi:N-acetyl-gamma-glutamyl-phosphate reductase
MAKVGIIGASGYGGAELLRLAAQHSELDVVVATGDTQAGTPIATLYPSLAGAYDGLSYAPYDAAAVDGLDVVFLALPHGASQAIVPGVLGRVGHVIDLAADFRLTDPSLYPQWYGEPHTAPQLLGTFAYGLPELNREQIARADGVAVPGCYPTAAGLALAPLARAGAIDTTGVIVDAATGVSGAGRDKFPFCGTDEDFRAYGLLDHRHTPEIEQLIDGQVLFTPHLAPMNRGILATCYARPAHETSTDALLGILHDTYDDEPFVVVSESSPSTKATLGSNSAHLTARYDERTGWAIALCAIDNLGKGAAGAAVHCANIRLELPETTGLPVVGVYP